MRAPATGIFMGTATVTGGLFVEPWWPLGDWRWAAMTILLLLMVWLFHASYYDPQDEVKTHRAPLIRVTIPITNENVRLVMAMLTIAVVFLLASYVDLLERYAVTQQEFARFREHLESIKGSDPW